MTMFSLAFVNEKLFTVLDMDVHAMWEQEVATRLVASLLWIM